MRVTVEFHADCAWTSVSSLQIVAAGASIGDVTELASRKVSRVVTALPALVPGLTAG